MQSRSDAKEKEQDKQETERTAGKYKPRLSLTPLSHEAANEDRIIGPGPPTATSAPNLHQMTRTGVATFR